MIQTLIEPSNNKLKQKRHFWRFFIVAPTLSVALPVMSAVKTLRQSLSPFYLLYFLS
jgi:hypothetical protein